MERDERVLLLGLAQRHPTTIGIRELHAADAAGQARSLALPISASAVTRTAVGAALAGVRPVVTWPDAGSAAEALAAIMSQAAPSRYLSGGVVSLPIVFRAPIGASRDAETRCWPSPEGWFSSIPGLKVVLPATPRDARGLLKSAIRDDNPVLFCEHQRLAATRGEVPEDEETIPLGVAEVKRAGADVSLVTYSAMLEPSLAAAELLADEGVSVEVLDLRCSLPLDEAAIVATVARTGRLVIVQEAPAACSVASEVAALVAEKALYHLDAPVRRVTARWAPVPFAPELACAVLPQIEQIVTAVRETLVDEG
jgi:pyruvate dehydrogenase E1 component beta subunit